MMRKRKQLNMAGCIQKFGVTTLRTKNDKYLYAAGKDSEGTEFVKWNPLPDIKIEGALFSSTEVMKGFFDYEWSDKEVKIDTSVVFVANYKVLQGQSEVKNLLSKTIIASGTKTWFELSKKSYWVTGCTDALGFEFLLSSLNMPLLNIQAEEISILTHEAAAERWRLKGYNAVSNYKQIPKNDETIRESIVAAKQYSGQVFHNISFMENMQNLMQNIYVLVEKLVGLLASRSRAGIISNN
jgi:hypothetical protein